MVKKNTRSIIPIIVLIIVGQHFFLQYFWDTSEHIYAIALVKGKGGAAGPSKHVFHYEINGQRFSGSSYHLKQGKYYIVVVPEKRKSSNELFSKVQVDPRELVPQPPSGWTECPINEDGTIKEKYKCSNDPWYLKKVRYVVGEAMDTSMRYIYRFKWRYASVSNVEIGKHYMLKINADNLKQYELVSTVPIDTAKLQIQTNGGWEECPVTKEGAIKDKFKK